MDACEISRLGCCFVVFSAEQGLALALDDGPRDFHPDNVGVAWDFKHDVEHQLLDHGPQRGDRLVAR